MRPLEVVWRVISPLDPKLADDVDALLTSYEALFAQRNFPAPPRESVRAADVTELSRVATTSRRA